MENPETRTFEINPLSMIRRNRGLYISACLTICRAYITAGKPGRLPPIESYEDWSDLVRSALVWLGHADPIDTMEAARGTDPVRKTRTAIFQAWRDELGTDQLLMTAEIVEMATARYDYDQSLVRPKLHAALVEAVPQRSATSQIDALRLCIWLKKNQNTIAYGLKLMADRSDATRPKWQLIRPG